MKHFFACCLSIILLFLSAGADAQVVVTSSDSLSCFVPCTTLSATFIGDNPIDAGITLDDYYPDVPNPIGFVFNFYGTNYSKCLIGPNGTLCFDTTLEGLYDDWMITAPLLGNPTVFNSVCGPWCDIDIEFGGTITYSTDGSAPNRRYVVTFCHDAMYDTTHCPNQFTTTQIILYETTNIVEVHVGYKDTCTLWNNGYGIIGVENATGSAATAAPGRDFPSVFLCLDEAWRFTPVGGGASYTVASISYAPIPYASSLLYWYNNNTGAYLGTGTSKTVCPGVVTTYKAGALGCSDTSFGYYTVTPGSITVTTSSTNPSLCGVCDGTITISGLTPGLSDTLNYDLGGVPQPQSVIIIPGSGMIDMTGLCAGTYSNITVKQGVCVSAPVTIILSNPAITATATFTNPSLCGVCDGSLVLHGLYPGHAFTVNYDFNGVAQPAVSTTSSGAGTLTLTGLCAGAYTNIIASFGSCATPALSETLVNPGISISSVSETIPTVCDSCDGIMVLNGLYPDHAFTVSYDFNGIPYPPLSTTSSGTGTITLSGLCSGVYNNIVASFGACITPGVGPYSLGWPPGLPINLTGFSSPSQCGFCDGEIIIKSVPPYFADTVFYSFNGVAQPSLIESGYVDSSIRITGLCAGVYSDFTVKSGPCIHPVIGSAILVAPPLTASFTDTIHYGCHGYDSVFFYNTSYSAGPLHYTWHFGDGPYTDSAASPVHVFAQGVYTVTLVADNHVCIDSMKATDSLVNPLHAGFTVSPDTLCQHNLVTFTDTSSGTILNYAWNFGNGYKDNSVNSSFFYNVSGVYHVQLVVSDFVPCHDTATTIVYVDSISSLGVAVTDTTICEGVEVTIGATYTSIGNIGLVWNFGNGDTVENANPVVYAYDKNGQFAITASALFRACPDISASRHITVFPQPHVNLGPDTSICLGSESITLADNMNAGNAAASWVWNTGQTTPAITIAEPGSYYVTVHINGCHTSDTIAVQNSCYINIPNVFSPNGDGLNDYFFPRQYLTKGLTSFSMNIYNRWGELIFQANTLDGAGWDGKFNNVPQPEGVYIYVIDATFKDGEKEHHQGNVTLLR